MIKNKLRVALAALLISASSTYASTAATAGGAWVVDGTIAGTPHDLSGGTAGDNGEVCVYCHTPHASNSNFSGAPLWNKADVNASSFTMYGASSAGTAGSTIANTATSATPESPSLACLSCHDGVSAIDSIVNAPGSGSGSLSTGTMTISENTTDVNNGNLGTDLTNDHPVSIIYTETTAASLRLKTVTLSAITGGGEWVGATTVGDLLRNDRVECGSCHDPHNGYASDQLGDQVNYLRRTNEGSQLCLGCHDK